MRKSLCHNLLKLLCGPVLCLTICTVPLWAEEVYKSMNESHGITKLPAPEYDSAISLEEVILKRKSVRVFSGDPLTVSEISQLLWAGQGMIKRNRRTVPSAGALYPLEVYVVAGNVNGLPPGIYKYQPEKHELASIVKGDLRKELCDAALGQSSIRMAPAVVVLSGVYDRTTVKYGERGIRYVHMEAGHAAQNVYLQTVSLGLGTVAVGAFHDEAVKKVMKMADSENPLYILPVGKQ
jgi:SagB-type dehydrogenase family enzyme